MCSLSGKTVSEWIIVVKPDKAEALALGCWKNEGETPGLGQCQGKLPGGSDAETEFLCVCVFNAHLFPWVVLVSCVPLFCPPLAAFLVELSCQESSG